MCTAQCGKKSPCYPMKQIAQLDSTQSTEILAQQPRLVSFLKQLSLQVEYLIVGFEGVDYGTQ